MEMYDKDDEILGNQWIVCPYCNRAYPDSNINCNCQYI